MWKIQLAWWWPLIVLLNLLSLGGLFKGSKKKNICCFNGSVAPVSTFGYWLMRRRMGKRWAREQWRESLKKISSTKQCVTLYNSMLNNQFDLFVCSCCWFEGIMIAVLRWNFRYWVTLFRWLDHNIKIVVKARGWPHLNRTFYRLTFLLRVKSSENFVLHHILSVNSWKLRSF